MLFYGIGKPLNARRSCPSAAIVSNFFLEFFKYYFTRSEPFSDFFEYNFEKNFFRKNPVVEVDNADEPARSLDKLN